MRNFHNSWVKVADRLEPQLLPETFDRKYIAYRKELLDLFDYAREFKELLIEDFNEAAKQEYRELQQIKKFEAWAKVKIKEKKAKEIENDLDMTPKNPIKEEILQQTAEDPEKPKTLIENFSDFLADFLICVHDIIFQIIKIFLGF